MATRFACPPQCGWCCTHLTRDEGASERVARRDFRAALADLGVFSCGHGPTGLSLSGAEAAAFRARAAERSMRVRLHPRTFLLETRRRVVVALDWHFPYASCPFYADWKCTVYEDRPLVCRAFPVMGAAPAWALAPQCPETAGVHAARAQGRVVFGSFLRDENAARRAVERAHAALDESAMRALDAQGTRFARGLAPPEAARRARTWRVVELDAFLARG